MANHAWNGEHNWVVGEPITQEKMNSIEGGIATALEQQSDINRLDNRLDKIDGGSAFNDSTYQTMAEKMAALGTTASNAASDALQALENAQQGQDAWTYVAATMEFGNGTNEAPTRSLKARLENDEQAISTANTNATIAQTWVNDAKVVGGNVWDAPNNRFKPAESLAERIGEINRLIENAQSTANSTAQIITPTNGRSFGERLNALDGNTTPTMNVPQIITEITDARGTNAQGGDNTALADRFTQDETRISANETAISNLTTNKVNVADIVDNLNQTDVNKPLSAHQGNVIKQMFGTGVGTAQGTTVAELISTAQSNAESNAESYADTNKVDKDDIYNGVDHTANDQKVLDARVGKTLQDEIDTINSNLNTANTGLVARVAANESAITTLNGNASTSGSVLNTVNTRIAEVVNSAPEAFDTLKEIADWIGENSDDALTMQQNISNNADAISALQTTIDHTQGQNDEVPNGLKQRITALETSVDTAESGLLDRMTAVESTANAAATATDLTDLAGRVTTLENAPKSATVIIESVTYDSNGIPTSIQNPSTDVDYLLKKDDKYYYWKYIKTSSNPDIYEWALISGSGSGNTSAFVYTAEEYANLDSVEENIDYYVLEDDGYHHYRYIGANEIEIGTSKKYNAYIETIDNEGTSVHYFNLYEFNQNEDDTVTEDNLETLYNNGKRKVHLLLPATGGGGVVNNMKILPVTPRNTSMAFNSSVPTQIRFFFTTGEANEPASYNFTVDGTTILNLPQAITSGDPANKSYSWPVDENDNELSEQAAAALGFYAIDISNYCNTVGTHTVRITVALDSNSSITVDQTWTVTTFNLSIASNFTNNPIYTQGENVSFTYIPSGNVEKVAHFKLDGTEVGTATLSAKTNTEQRYTISSPATAGAHKLEVYLTANNGATKSSSIYRDIIWQDANSSDIIIASPYRGDTNIKLTQYELLTIPYTIVGGNNRYTVEYFVDDMEHSVNEVSLINTNAGQWNYRADTDGAHTLKIKCGNTYITFNVNVQESLYDIAPVESPAPIIDFNPSGITNTSSKRLWTNGTYSLSVSDNFDWYNGGYGTDINGDYFLVKAGTRAIFDYKMFKGYSKTVDEAITTASTVFRDGQEMKIIFKTSAVRSADAVWFTNVAPTNDTSAAKDVGIQLNVHNGWLKTDSAQDSTKSYLYFPYSEEDRIELDININPDTAPNAVYIMSYEDGCPSRAYPYKTTEALYQHSGSEAPITIGSDDCDVYIYRLRIYDNALDTEQVLRNFIADGKDVTEKLERYSRNSIYYDTQAEEFTPYTGPDTILDPERLAQKIPDVKILMLEAPRFTTEKKDFVANSSLRCIHAPGGKIYPSRGKEDNWFFGNGYHSGQGTTSDKYGDAGRNVDFLFNCDGIHNPSDKVTPGKGFIEGYQSYVIKGYGTDEQEEPEYCSDWKGDDCKISLTSTSIPNNFFNLKVNIASSENVNNALFQKRFNDFLKDIYETPAYKRDNRIKNDMEFVPAILFIRETDTTHTEETVENKQVINYTNHKEFNDTEWHFYALGNLGDSKKTDYTRAYDPTDMNEFTLEISDNNTNNSQFQTGVYMKNGVRTIEDYTVEQDYDEEKQKYKDTYSAISSEHDITVLTTDYLYPIDRATEWEAVDDRGNPINMRYWGLMNEKFDGDHSFEMRYACEGNYRDGKLVNDTHGNTTISDGEGGYITKDTYQLELNTRVWQSFYTWLVTSTDQQFVNELELWCVKSAVAYFYAFTHYYTMIDNRAKNTFWHYAKTGVRRAVPIGRAFEGLMHIYEQDDGNGGYEPATEPFDNTKQYYTQYAFDMWAYDMDTAAGIDNNGELIFPYGKEDTDYRVKDDPSSGRVYNGAGSVFWARLRQNCSDSITAAFTGVSQECFNADNLIVEFDKVQNCYPEAIWRLDVERKYIRPFTGDTEAPDDNPYQDIALTRQNSRFLGDMMQGRKKYQRRQWIKNQDVYFGSKYMLSSVSGNQFDMVCYTIADQNVKPNWDVTITPYQDMYLNVDYGETVIRGRRAYAGVPVEIKCPFTEMSESRLRIYGADYIQALAGKAIREDENDPDSRIIGAESLASLYFRGNDFSHANKLRELIIGSPDPTYNNSQFTTLNISNRNPNLELLDIQNCGGLGGAIDLTQSTALKTVNAQGTSLTQVNLPSSTGIINLYLPTSITRLALIAAKNLTNLTIKARTAGSADPNTPIALSELIVNDSDYSSNINWMDIAKSALSHLTNLQLLGLSGHSSIQNIDELDSFAERKNELGTSINENGDNVALINLNGTINITGNWSSSERDYYGGTPSSIWPDLYFDVSQATEQIKYPVTYHYDNTTLVKYVVNGTVPPDIYADGTIKIPTKDSTPRYRYTFGTYENVQGNYDMYSGWSYSNSENANHLPSAPDTISGPTHLYAWFNRVERTYYVRWYLKPNQLIKTSGAIKYGEGYNLENPTIKEIHNSENYFETCTVNVTNEGLVSYSIFTGWNKLPTNITPDGTSNYYDIYGVWDTETNISIGDLFADNTKKTAQLLVLSVLTEEQKSLYHLDSMFDEGTQITYELGQDNNLSSGHQIVPQINSNTPLYLDGSSNYSFSTAYQPLLAGSDAFTFAIDYAFDEGSYSSGTFAILASCYYSNNNVRNGFGLFKNTSTGNIEIGFGDMYRQSNQRVTVSTSQTNTMRNIVVIRHPKNSPTIYIYSGLDGNSTIALEASAFLEITRTGEAEFNSGAYLNIGQLISNQETIDSSDTVRWARAAGTIYWAKYWSEDLGIGECKRLAAWPHEQLTFAIASCERTNPVVFNTLPARANDNVNPDPALYLTTCNSLMHGLVTEYRTNYSEFENNLYYWEYANTRKLCNNRLLFSLPIELQSILCKAKVLSQPIEYVNVGQDQGCKLAEYALSTRDYLYAPSILNVSNNSLYDSEELNANMHPFSWKIPNNITIYRQNSNQEWVLSPASQNSQYFNIRFPYKTFNLTNPRIYFTDAALSSNVAESIGMDNLQSGDIYIENDIAYIYVSNREINTYGLNAYTIKGYTKFNGLPDSDVTHIGGGQGRGGWIRAESYWTRSLLSGHVSRTIFAEVKEDGSVNTNTMNSSANFKVNYIVAI